MNPATANGQLDLSRLRDIHLPQQGVSWWPPAPGWWIVAALAALLAIAVYWFLRRYRDNRWRRQALAELMQLQQQSVSGWQQVAQLSALLRRVAISCFPRQDVASLTGRAWLDFLDQHGGDFEAYADLLLTAPYRQDGAIDSAALLQRAEAWIRAVNVERGGA